ncbi:transporter [Oharaeibacter diazotrophicus]|uniref:Zinc transporter n=1 Tax=Oharaeibacter diazotrophicus TaxID=1920512 RepID=A0A4R6RLB7_9HYPH|nr:transporter [Oharaeibacter diazotrophicus]TDP86757.1 zinc transporter [Oharaeibacter diazotrophicus]BBE71300.1 zinc transport protein ZntB [Pleomorphomonas sp. SM30]GLS78055.1 transporter [Oharaeibacter diazotrophicus]
MNKVAREIPGLVWGYRFPAEGGAPETLGAVDGERALADGGFVWLHLALSDARVPGFLSGIDGLPAAALQTLTGRDDHPVTEIDDGIVHGVLVDFQREFDQETREFGWLRFAIGPGFILTTRLHPLRSVDRARSAVAHAGRIGRTSDVLELIVMEFVRALTGLVGEMTDELNLIEDYVYDDAPRDERRRLGPVRRLLARMHRHLRAMLSGFRKTEIADPGEVAAPVRDMAERLADRIERVNRDVFALQERARLLHEEIDSKISAETNRHLYILSVMTAFMLPPTLVAGIFGMNTADLPFLHEPGGTWYAVGLCAMSIALAWALLRRIGIF